MSEEIKGWQLVPLSMTPAMRELMLRADEFTVNEMWIMLLAAAPPAPAPDQTCNGVTDDAHKTLR